MAKDEVTLQREISQLAENLLMASVQGVGATVFALYQLGSYIRTNYPSCSIEDCAKILGNFQFNNLSAQALTNKQAALAILSAVLDELATLFFKNSSQVSSPGFPALNFAASLFYVIVRETTSTDELDWVPFNKVVPLEVEERDKQRHEIDRKLLEVCKLKLSEARAEIDRLLFILTPTATVLDKEALALSTNPVIQRIVSNNNIVPPAATPAIQADIARGLLVLDGIKEEEIAAHYNQELASVYSEAFRKHLEKKSINGNPVGGEAQTVCSKDEHGDIVAVVKSTAGYISDLDGNFKKTTTDISGNVTVKYRLSSDKISTQDNDDTKTRGFELESIEVSNSQLVNVVMNEKASLSVQEIADAAMAEESAMFYRYLVGNCIKGSTDNIHPSAELENFASNLLDLNEKTKFPEPSKALKAKAGHLFTGTKRYWLAPKRHRIYQAIASIPEFSAGNYNQATLSAYTRIVAETLDLHLVHGETLESYLDRARIVQIEGKQSPTITMGERGLSIENLKTAKAVLESPRPFSEDILRDRLLHLIKYNKPLTLDENGVYGLGKFSLVKEGSADYFFNKEGKFDYRKYIEQCEKISNSLMGKFEDINKVQEQQINKIICHALLGLQNKTIPAYALRVADAYANELSGVASTDDKEVIELAKSSLPTPEEKLIDALGDAAENGNFVQVAKKIVQEYTVDENKDAQVNADGKDLGDFLNCIQPDQAVKKYFLRLFAPYQQAEGIQVILALKGKIKDPALFFKAAQAIAQGRLTRSSWSRDPETMKIYQALAECKNFTEVNTKIGAVTTTGITHN